MARWILAGLIAVVVATPTRAGLNNPYEAHFPDTVYDYYRLLPSDYFFDWADKEPQRRDMLLNEKEAILDNAHDYLYVRGGDGQWAIEMALFRYHGNVTVGIASGSYDPDIPHIEFKQYQNGKWVDVTKRVLSPAVVKMITNKESDFPDHAMATYTLPEHGSTIVVHTRSGKDVKLRWFKGRFVAVH